MPEKLVKEFKIQNKIINLYCARNGVSCTGGLPFILLNTCQSEGQDVFEQCIENGSDHFVLAAVSNLDWNHDMTPWYLSVSGRNGMECLGRADAYCKLVEEEIIPQIRDFMEDNWNISISYHGIAGYSLAGLFAVYCAYKTHLFTKIASASGSFWFPGFLEFVKENAMCSGVEKIYFSLGKQEKKSNNPIFQAVEQNTREIEAIYRARGLWTIYEENEGNHFQDTVLRMAKGITWVLE